LDFCLNVFELRWVKTFNYYYFWIFVETFLRWGEYSVSTFSTHCLNVFQIIFSFVSKYFFSKNRTEWSFFSLLTLTSRFMPRSKKFVNVAKKLFPLKTKTQTFSYFISLFLNPHTLPPSLHLLFSNPQGKRKSFLPPNKKLKKPKC